MPKTPVKKTAAGKSKAAPERATSKRKNLRKGPKSLPRRRQGRKARRRCFFLLTPPSIFLEGFMKLVSLRRFTQRSS